MKHLIGNKYNQKRYPRDDHINIRANKVIKQFGQLRAKEKGITLSDHVESLLINDIKDGGIVIP